MKRRELVIATRGSKLALAQADLAAEALAAAGLRTRLLPVRTRGDIKKEEPLRTIGGNGLFVREIERVVSAGEADLAVHCGKDLPFALADGLVIGGVLPPRDARDCLVARRNVPVHSVATGSERRRAAFRKLQPDAEFVEVRGNLDTRLQRLADGEFDALLVAKAGLDRLQPDLSDFTVRELSVEELIPAACQGILALECRAEDAEVCAVLREITDGVALERFSLERAIFTALGANCIEAVGVYAELSADTVTVRAMRNDRQVVRTGARNTPERLVRGVVDALRG